MDNELPVSKTPYRSPLAIIEAIKPYIEGKVFCDLEVVAEDILKEAKKYAKEVKGFEVPSDMVEIAKQHGITNILINISSTENIAKAHWDAYYTFSATGRKVVNRIDAFFEIADGKIVRHTDKFNFYTWSRQALGLTGMLLGWTSFLNKKVSAKAMKNLANFMKDKP